MNGVGLENRGGQNSFSEAIGHLRPALMCPQAAGLARVHPDAGRELAWLAPVRQNVLQSPTEATPPTHRCGARLHYPSTAVRAQDWLNAPLIARAKRSPER